MLGQIPVPIPPIPEQKTIAEYLDAETTRIDTLVQEKEDLIDLLIEWRQSVIAQAVTKGLDKDVQMRATKIAWLRDIPVAWNEARLGHISKIYAGGTPSKDNPGYWGGDIPWLNSGCINQWLIQEPAEYITEEGYSGSSARWVPKGGLVMALAGQGKTKGMVAQLDIDATCNQSMAAIIPAEGEPRYLLYWLTTNYKNIRGMASDDTRDGLNLTMLGQIPVPIPPIPEQKTIAEYLDAETTRIDALIAHTTEDINLLKELRAATIADAVLGRIDVRETPHA
jgi:type I restriction enzyme S subunit